jgi:predicted phosphodiesterase
VKIGFISDIHSNIHALVEVLENIEELSIDEIWCCGDVVGYNAFPKECINIIKEKRIPSILGNHDWATLKGDTSWFNLYGVAGVEYSRKSIDEKDMSFLQELPNYRSFVRDNVSFYMAHGSPKDNVFEYVFPWSSDSLFETFAEMVDSEVIVLGHTHIPM